MECKNNLTSGRCYVKNQNPIFVPPARHSHKLPFVLSDAIKRNQSRDMTSDIAFYVVQPVGRQRRIYEARRKAINALLISILYHVNIVSRRVPVSAEALTDHCGLSTRSKAGNKSITRGTRALEMLKKLGFITYTRRWDRTNRQYFPADISITDQFIELVGINPEKWQAELNKKLAYYNNRNAAKLNKAITEKDYARIIREDQLERAYNYRSTNREIKAKQKAAKRMERLVDEKGEEELRHQISRQVSEEYHAGLIPDASLSELKSIVAKRFNTLKKIARSLH